MEKLFISAQQLLEDSFVLAKNVFDDGFRPKFIVGIWRGGAPVGIAIQEFFKYNGVVTDHIAIRTSAYDGVDHMQQTILVHGLHYLVERVKKNDAVLLVDDVFDTGRSIQAIFAALQKRLGDTMPRNVRVAVPYFKPARNVTKRIPDYYLHETTAWIYFPHELEGLTLKEIEKVKGKKIVELF